LRSLDVVDSALSPLSRETDLLWRLRATTPCGTERLRVIIAGRQLFLDGFAESVDHKHRVKSACRLLAPQSTLVNRLRVAVPEEPRAL
jgi:hypothetical protein